MEISLNDKDKSVIKNIEEIINLSFNEANLVINALISEEFKVYYYETLKEMMRDYNLIIDYFS